MSRGHATSPPLPSMDLNLIIFMGVFTENLGAPPTRRKITIPITDIMHYALNVCELHISTIAELLLLSPFNINQSSICEIMHNGWFYIYALSKRTCFCYVFR